MQFVQESGVCFCHDLTVCVIIRIVDFVIRSLRIGYKDVLNAVLTEKVRMRSWIFKHLRNVGFALGSVDPVIIEEGSGSGYDASSRERRHDVPMIAIGKNHRVRFGCAVYLIGQLGFGCGINLLFSFQLAQDRHDGR